MGLLLTISIATLAGAECACECVNGAQQAICSSAIELRPICPPRICPIVPRAITPIMPPYIPPIGTSGCRMEQVYNNFTGMYQFERVCR
jgi:hypothetical protein